MKRIIILFAVISLYHIVAFGQKKWEMVIEKTDGSEVVINTEDIIKTYFREVDANSSNNDGKITSDKIIGKWLLLSIEGWELVNGVKDEYVEKFNDNSKILIINQDGTFEDHTDDMVKGTWSLNGNNLNTKVGNLNYTFVVTITGDMLIIEVTVSDAYNKFTYKKL